MRPRSSPTLLPRERSHPGPPWAWTAALAVVSLGATAGCWEHEPQAPPEAAEDARTEEAPATVEPGGWVFDADAGMEVRCPAARWRCARDPHTGAAVLQREGEAVDVFLQRIVGAKTLREGVDRLAVVGARLVNTRQVRSRRHARGRQVTFEERRPSGADRAQGARTRSAGTGAETGADVQATITRRFWALVTRRADGAIVVCQGGAPRDRFEAVVGEIQSLCETMREPLRPTTPDEGAKNAPSGGADAQRGEREQSPRLGATIAHRTPHMSTACPKAAGWTCLPAPARDERRDRLSATPSDSRTQRVPARPPAPGRVIARGPHGETLRVFVVHGATSLTAAVDALAARAGQQAGVATLHQRKHRLGVQLDYERPARRSPQRGAETAREHETVWILLRALPEGGVLACQGTAPTPEFAGAAPILRSACESLLLKDSWALTEPTRGVQGR